MSSLVFLQLRSRVMLRNVLVQSSYQLTVTLYLVYQGATTFGITDQVPVPLPCRPTSTSAECCRLFVLVPAFCSLMVSFLDACSICPTTATRARWRSTLARLYSTPSCCARYQSPPTAWLYQFRTVCVVLIDVNVTIPLSFAGVQ